MLVAATPSQATKQECSFIRVSYACSYADVASILTSLRSSSLCVGCANITSENQTSTIKKFSASLGHYFDRRSKMARHFESL